MGSAVSSVYVAESYDLFDRYLTGRVSCDAVWKHFHTRLEELSCHLLTQFPSIVLVLPEKMPIIHLNQVYRTTEGPLHVVFTLTPSLNFNSPFVLINPGESYGQLDRCGSNPLVQMSYLPKALKWIPLAEARKCKDETTVDLSTKSTSLSQPSCSESKTPDFSCSTEQESTCSTSNNSCSTSNNSCSTSKPSTCSTSNNSCSTSKPSTCSTSNNSYSTSKPSTCSTSNSSCSTSKSSKSSCSTDTSCESSCSGRCIPVQWDLRRNWSCPLDLVICPGDVLEFYSTDANTYHLVDCGADFSHTSRWTLPVIRPDRKVKVPFRKCGVFFFADRKCPQMRLQVKVTASDNTSTSCL